MRFIKLFWNVIVIASLLLGVLYLPADIIELPQKYPQLNAVVAMIDRFDLVVAVAVLAILYIFWMDIRPTVSRWLRGRRVPAISVMEHIYVECTPIPIPGHAPAAFYANRFYLVVGNGLPDGKLLRRVQCRVYQFGEPTILPVKGNILGEIDIRHGEWAHFELGRIVSTSVIGFIKLEDLEVPPEIMRSYEHNIKLGYLNFEIHSSQKKVSCWLSDEPRQNTPWSLEAIITADNVTARRVRIEIDMANKQQPVIWKDIDLGN